MFGDVKLLLEKLTGHLQSLLGQEVCGWLFCVAVMTAAYMAIVLYGRVVPWLVVPASFLVVASSPVMRGLVPEDSVRVVMEVAVVVVVLSAVVAGLCVQVLNDELCHVPGDVRIDEEPHYVEHRREIARHS